VPPDQRRLLHALARSLPWALAAIVLAVVLCLALGVPRLAVSLIVPAVAVAVPLACTREERREARAAARARGGGRPRGPGALAAVHVAACLTGVPLATQGLRAGNRTLAMAGTALLAIVVLDSAVLFPWRTARRQRRER
jgi:hypothetical protein